MIRFIILFSLTSLVITACTAMTELPAATIIPSRSPSPSPISSSTPIPKTSTPLPFTTTTPVIVIEDPNIGLTPTPTLLPFSLPKESIGILRPAVGSNVTSPFRVNGYAGPSWNNRVELRLIGEDGRLASRTIAYILALPGYSGPFTAEMDFETTLVAESARLEVSTFSIRDTKINHLASVDLILLSIGAPLVHWTMHGPEQITILSPREYETIRGGTALVKGVGWVNHLGSLQMDILDREGNVVGTTQVQINTGSLGEAGTFEGEIQYQIDETQLGRIVIYEVSQTIPGIIHYTSLIVNLTP